MARKALLTPKTMTGARVDEISLHPLHLQKAVGRDGGAAAAFAAIAPRAPAGGMSSSMVEATLAEEEPPSLVVRC